MIIRALTGSFDPARLHYSNYSENLDIYLLKHRDIPGLVATGRLDYGITLQEWVVESSVEVKEIIRLDWCDTRISLIAPPESSLASIGNTRELRCVTEFPHIAESFFQSEGWKNYHIETISGSCEGLVPTMYDCIVDCVETGHAMEKNDLVEHKIIMHSKTVLIARNNDASGIMKLLDKALRPI
jgi:ATP phosphoribosyltransferase